MERFIQSIKTSQGERYEVMLSISKEAYGIQWYFAKDAVKLSGIVMHEEENHFDVVSFYDKTSWHLMHEAEYRYRYKDGKDI